MKRPSVFLHTSPFSLSLSFHFSFSFFSYLFYAFMPLLSNEVPLVRKSRKNRTDAALKLTNVKVANGLIPLSRDTDED